MSQMLIFFVFLHLSSILAQTCSVFHLIFANNTVDTLFFLCDFRRLAGKKEMQTMKFLAQFLVFFANFS